MKMTNREAYQHILTLHALRETKLSLPVVTGYRILQNLRALEDAAGPYIEARDSIIKKYSKGKEELTMSSDPGAFKACTIELSEIDVLEVDVNIVKVHVNQIENLNLTLDILFDLDFMLEG